MKCGDTMKFKLVEDFEQLNEAVEPSYRDMLFLLIGLLTDNEDLKKLVNNESDRKELEFHHIDGEYITRLTGRKKASNNKPDNIAIVYKDAHKYITKLNRKYPDSKVHNFNDAMSNEDYKDRIFPLYDCLPGVAAKVLTSELG